jgi:endonuclease/exonuclease/phosphatase family metal-dependent hydrolase
MHDFSGASSGEWLPIVTVLPFEAPSTINTLTPFFMRLLSCRCALAAVLVNGGFILISQAAEQQLPVVTQTSVTMRVMAANITTGNNQRYEGPGLRIFQGLKPDVVAVQEFNYASTNGLGINTPAALREMIDGAFGTNFVFFRESGYSIPNGIISRWPILDSGSWDDVQVPDRGFAWALIDLPGTNDLYLVSVHLHSSGGSSSRATEALNLKSLIQSNFPSNAWVMVAGDLNTDTRNEAAVTTFKTFLSDSPIPADNNGNPNTNLSRQRPYDYVLPGFSFATNQTATVIGTQQFAGGLVFDSRVYSPTNEVAPVLSTDSSAPNMQHMAVVKDFRVSYTVTNLVTVPAPRLEIVSANVIHWIGLSQLAYTVQTNGSLTDWAAIGTATSSSSEFWFTYTAPVAERGFFRVVYP